MLQNDGKDMAKAMREHFAAKDDRGKPQLHLVPTQMTRDVAEVRMYGNHKYGDPENWKDVELGRYLDALYRHLLCVIDDPHSKDEESGIPHYKHMACNMAFICEILKKKNADLTTKARG